METLSLRRHPDRRRRPAAAACLATAAALLAGPTPLLAADPIGEFVRSQLGEGNRVEVAVGSLDPRIQLAPCARIEPYMLPGTRLWGRSAIGVRCTEGADWKVALPITVTVWGRALVAAGPLAAGSTVTEADLREEEVELTREHGTPVTDPAQLVGMTLTRPVPAGHTLRQEYFKVTQTVSPGDPVQIRVAGRGFTVLADGRALNGAGEGQSLRVRTGNGRVVAGVLRGRTIEIGP